MSFGTAPKSSSCRILRTLACPPLIEWLCFAPSLCTRSICARCCTLLPLTRKIEPRKARSPASAPRRSRRSTSSSRRERSRRWWVVSRTMSRGWATQITRSCLLVCVYACDCFVFLPCTNGANPLANEKTSIAGARKCKEAYVRAPTMFVTVGGMSLSGSC